MESLKHEMELSQQTAPDNLWQTANIYRSWVCEELCHLHAHERDGLRGSYLFIINQFPHFLVCVESEQAYSIDLSCSSLKEQTPPASRVTISTDSLTLKKLLNG